MGFEWSVNYCTFNYLLEADDDVFVNTLGLVDFLSKYTTLTKAKILHEMVDTRCHLKNITKQFTSRIVAEEDMSCRVM